MSNNHSVVGKLKIVKIRNEDFLVQKNRKIRIWIPDSYDKKSAKPYDVIYMFDAQNLFDAATSYSGEWYVDEAIDGIEFEDKTRPSIVVGIDNSSDRMSELMPRFTDFAIGPFAYKGQVTLDYIVKQVIPYVEANYNVGKTRSYRAIGGSSMGGLMALAAGISYPRVFSQIYAFSADFPIYKFGPWEEPPIRFGTGTDEAFDYVVSKFSDKKMINKFRIGITAGGQGIEKRYAPYPLAFANKLKAAGWKEDNLLALLNSDYEHCEAQWAYFFPLIYRFMKKKKA